MAQTVLEKIVRTVCSKPDHIWTTSEVQDKAGISYPVTKLLYRAATEKMVRNRGRGKWSAPKEAAMPARNHKSHAGSAIRGVIEEHVEVSQGADGLVAMVGSERYEITWPDFVTALRVVKKTNGD